MPTISYLKCWSTARNLYNELFNPLTIRCANLAQVVPLQIIKSVITQALLSNIVCIVFHLMNLVFEFHKTPTVLFFLLSIIYNWLICYIYLTIRIQNFVSAFSECTPWVLDAIRKILTCTENVPGLPHEPIRKLNKSTKRRRKPIDIEGPENNQAIGEVNAVAAWQCHVLQCSATASFRWQLERPSTSTCRQSCMHRHSLPFGRTAEDQSYSLSVVRFLWLIHLCSCVIVQCPCYL